MYYTRFKTSLCEIILAGDDSGLKHLHLNTGEGKRTFEIQPHWKKNDSFFSDAKKQIKEYCEGSRKTFEIKLNPEGTDFQKMVWKKLTEIPFGETRTYGEIATLLGKKQAARAIGMANHKNPLPLVIPCHRVIGSNGELAGFAHGTAIKERLLEIEARNKLKVASNK